MVKRIVDWPAPEASTAVKLPVLLPMVHGLQAKVPCDGPKLPRKCPRPIPSGCQNQFADRNEVFASTKNPTEGEVGEMQRASRHDLARALAPRYGHVSKGEKGQILDQVCEVTGYTRKYALTLLKQPPRDEPPVRRTRRRSQALGT